MKSTKLHSYSKYFRGEAQVYKYYEGFWWSEEEKLFIQVITADHSGYNMYTYVLAIL
jgi:hypothetical protein